MKLQLIAGVAVSLLSAAAYAHGPCKDDIAKLCGDVKPGEGRLGECLKAHEADVSPACKTEMTAEKQKMEEWNEACKADRESLCKDVPNGNGRVAACMHDNEAKLSAGCKAKFAHAKKRMSELHTACAQDLKTNCKAVKAGHAAKIACLNEHMDTLSAACKAEMDGLQ